MIKEEDFKYCPGCGSTFNPLKENVLICSVCELHYYINPKPANAVMIENDKNEILFVERAFNPKKGMLDLPGGFLNINESVEESLTREIREELGITIAEFTYVNSFSDEYEHGGVSSRSICVLFRCKLPDHAVLTPADDVSDYRFYSKDHIPYDEMAFDGMKEAVRRYLHNNH